MCSLVLLINKQKTTQTKLKRHIFESKNDMRKSLLRFFYGDLYIIGKLWTNTLKSALVGGKMNLFPVVEAAAPPEPPKRPPPMKYKDLPIYESPHYDYKAYIEKETLCPAANVKLLHEILLPYVKLWRKDTEEAIDTAKSALHEAYRAASETVNDSINEVTAYMRDPERIALRQGVVAAGAIVGYIIAYGGGFPRKVFFSGLGVLASGALCFPKETDKEFRNFMYHTSKIGLQMYNIWCGKQLSLREMVACRSDLPLTPPKRPPPVKCPVPIK